MKDVLGPGTVLGYCTNVHAGNTLEQVQTHLDRHSVAVRRQVSATEPMGIGLWLSAPVARKLVDTEQIGEFSNWLAQRGLLPFTLNGFPYGDFHTSSVKHRVYQPDWRDPKRLAYTMDLITILQQLLPNNGNNGDGNNGGNNGDNPHFDPHFDHFDSQEGSISTLPIAWHGNEERSRFSETDMDAVVGHLHQVIDHLFEIEQATGQLIHLDLEPEPGCVLQTSQDVVHFFESHLDRLGSAQRNRRYLRVCLDTCHEAVMFEEPHETLQRYNSTLR